MQSYVLTYSRLKQITFDSSAEVLNRGKRQFLRPLYPTAGGPKQWHAPTLIVDPSEQSIII